MGILFTALKEVLHSTLGRKSENTSNDSSSPTSQLNSGPKEPSSVASSFKNIPLNERLTIWEMKLDANPIYYVYVHKNLNGEIFYVGKGHKRRAWRKSNRNPYWNNIVAKEGLKVKIISTGLNEEDAFLEEIRYIDKLKPRANLMTGFTGHSHLPRNKEIIKLVAEKCRKTWTAEKREARAKMYLGSNNPFYQKKHTSETKQKLQQKRQRKIECLNILTGEICLVSGTRQASEQTKVPRQTIMRLLQTPTQKQKVGWLFRRLD